MKWVAYPLVILAAAFALAVGRTERAGPAGVPAPIRSASVDAPRTRLEFPGFAVLPPPGDGWELLANPGTSRPLLGFDLLFIKIVSPTELAHAYVAVHRIPGESAAAKILEESFHRFIKSRNPTSVIALGHESRPNCLRWEMMHETTRYFHGIQLPVQPAWESQYQGYLCSHPDAPTYVVEIGYFDTIVSGEANSRADEAEMFLRGFSLTRLGAKVSQFPVGHKPRGVAQTDGALWLTEENLGAVSRIDPKTGSLVASIPVGKKPEGLAAGAGAVWVPNWASDSISRIDPTTNRVAATIPIQSGPTAIAVRGGAVWVTCEKSRSVARIDASTNRVNATISTGGRPAAIAASHDAIWVENFGTNSIWRIDPETRQAVSILVGRGRHLITSAHNAVWVSNSIDDSVSRIDPAAGRVIATVKVGRIPMGLVAAGGMLWVANFGDSTLMRIDPKTDQVTGAPIPVGENPFLLDTDAGTVWALDVWGWEEGTLSKVRFDQSN